MVEEGRKEGRGGTEGKGMERGNGRLKRREREKKERTPAKVIQGSGMILIGGFFIPLGSFVVIYFSTQSFLIY